MSMQSKGNRSRNLNQSSWKADMILGVHQKNAAFHVLHPRNRWLPFEIAGFDSVFKGCWNSQNEPYELCETSAIVPGAGGRLWFVQIFKADDDVEGFFFWCDA